MLNKSIDSANFYCDSRKRSLTVSDFQKKVGLPRPGDFAEPQAMDLFQHIRLLLSD
jgi:hypothetical protein